jgi:hypothetical protein
MMPKNPVVKYVVLASLLLAATACTSNDDSAREASDATPGSRPGATDAASRTGLVYAAVVHQLVEVDHGYGKAPSPYRRVYVIDGAVPHAAELPGGTGFRRVAQPFDADVKAEITRQLDETRPVTFVRSRSRVIGGRSSGSPGEVTHGGVLVTLGPVNWINSRTAHVGNNRWAAGKDGQWLVYTVQTPTRPVARGRHPRRNPDLLEAGVRTGFVT